jgi:hypothetical protein
MSCNSGSTRHTKLTSNNAMHHLGLAEIIRGAPTAEVVETFKALAKIVVEIWKVRKMEDEDQSSVESIRCLFEEAEADFRSYQHQASRSPEDGTSGSDAGASNDRNDTGDGSTRVDRPRSHLLSRLDITKLFTFLYENVDALEETPEYVVLVQGDEEITKAEFWLIRCTIQNLKRNDQLRSLWLQYLEEQPDYDPPETPNERFERNVRRFNDDGSLTCFPGLVQILRHFVHGNYFDKAGAHIVLGEYLALGATAAGLWAHMWQDHGIQRGQPLADDDHHVEIAIQSIEESFSDRIQDWESAAPLHVREELAQHCFEGDFLFLTNHVFPTAVAPSGSEIREDMFTKEMHQYIVKAATSVDVDPRGRIRRLIEEQGWYPETQPNGTYVRPHQIRRFMSFRNASEEQDLTDVELEAKGPFINVDDIAEPCVPTDRSICTICQDEITDKGSACVQLLVCEHEFHCNCLHTWVNGVHDTQVLCPNCRAEICDARERRAKL